MKVHELKIAPEYMAAQLAGLKNFEIRRNDRAYKVGNEILLREFDGVDYTGRQMTVYITYITDYKQKNGYVVLGTCKIGDYSDRIEKDAEELESSDVKYELKIPPKYMDAQLAGLKNFEIRQNEYEYQAGENILLREWTDGHYTGRQSTFHISYVTHEAKTGYTRLGTL